MKLKLKLIKFYNYNDKIFAITKKKKKKKKITLDSKDFNI